MSENKDYSFISDVDFKELENFDELNPTEKEIFEEDPVEEVEVKECEKGYESDEYLELDGIKAYLRDIGQYELLTSEEEIRYAKIISSEGDSVEIKEAKNAMIEEDSTLGDFVENKNLVSPETAAEQSELRRELDLVLSSLTEKEERIIRMRFGLDDNRARTLEEVGAEFGVTRERIRQIEAKALRKLRVPSKANRLAGFLTA